MEKKLFCFSRKCAPEINVKFGVNKEMLFDGKKLTTKRKTNLIGPTKRKANLIETLVHRALMICSKSKLQHELKNIRSIQRNNEYPESFI